MAVGGIDDVYTVLIAKYGTRTTRRSEVFLNFDLYHEPDSPMRMDYFFWVVRNGARTVVVDTGFSRHGGEARGREMLIDPIDLFARLDVVTAEAPTVLVTHAHYDHIGNLKQFGDSIVVAAERELAFWTGPIASRRLFHHSVEDDEIEYLARLADRGQLQTFHQRCTVAPGIELIELAGHTPGQSVVRVRTAAGNVLLASDALHYDEELALDRPFSSVTSVAETYESFQAIREMQASGEVDIIVTGHDPGTLDRFEPLVGDLSHLVATIGGVA